ncbi:MAG: NADH-quinone oxidoreductase subunit NuoE [Vicinamibacteraceae bacterium]
MSFHPSMPYGEGWHRSQRRVPPDGPPFAFTPENLARLEEICSHYPPEQRKSAIIAALYLVQEQQGHITGNAMKHVAEVIDCPPAQVEDVVSYYVMFFTRPVGRYVLQVCRTLSCALRGAERVTEALCQHLQVHPGDTTADGMFTVIEFECLGACDRAPVVMVNNEHWHECQDPERVTELVDTLRSRGVEGLSGCHLVREK